MDLSLSQEQTMIKNSAQEFLRQELPKERVDELFRSETGHDPELWKKMGSLGWIGMSLPTEYGGQASNFTTIGVLFEELGAALCPSPLLSSVLAGQIVLQAGNDSQKRQLLPSIARGDLITAVAFTEASGSWDPDSIGLTASRRGDTFELNGTKAFVPDAHLADYLLVVGKSDDSPGLSVFLVDRAARGLTVRPHTGWLGDVLCEVTLDSVRVPASAAIGVPGTAGAALESAIDKATALLCAYMLGGCRRVLEISVEYSQNRIQFGVPIGNFQRVQDHLIEALNSEQSTRWTTYEALWKLDGAASDAQLAISMAKAVASDAYFTACEAAHHVHGGIGVDMNYGLAYFTQKSRTLQHYMGDAVHHRRRMAALLRGAAA